MRRRVEVQILNIAAANVLPAERNIICWAQDYFNGLVSVIMTTLFSMLRCASHVFSLFSFDTNQGVPTRFHLPDVLQTLVSLVYCWPTVEADGA